MFNDNTFEVIGLNELCDVRDGTHDSPKYLDSSKYKFITSKNIVGDSIDFSDCKYIKECVRKAFNIVLRKHRWRDCEDSKSSLTTKKHYLSGSKTLFSIDVCIVYEDEDGNLYRLIHKKTGYNNVNSIAYAASIYPGLVTRRPVNEYYWNKAPNSRNIKFKVDYIKSNGKWELVREQYKSIKNRYLTQNDHNHPSFICYIEAVNNVYNSRKHWKQ